MSEFSIKTFRENALLSRCGSNGGNISGFGRPGKEIFLDQALPSACGLQVLPVTCHVPNTSKGCFHFLFAAIAHYHIFSSLNPYTSVIAYFWRAEVWGQWGPLLRALTGLHSYGKALEMVYF